MTAPPPPPRVARLLFGLRPAGRRWPGAFRAAAAFGIPAFTAWIAGFETESLLIVSGSFAVIYGEGRPYRSRWKIVLAAGVCLVVAVWLGNESGTAALRLGDTAPAAMIPILTLAVVGVVAVYVVAALRLGPPGAFFFVLVCAVSSYLPRADISATRAAVCAGIGALSALVVAMSGALVAARAPEHDAVSSAVDAVDLYAADITPGNRHVAASALHAGWVTVYDAGLPSRSPRPVLVRTLFDAHRRFAATSRRTVTDIADADSVDDQLPLARPHVGYRLLRSLHRDSHAATTAARVFVAALLAGSLSVALGLGRPDWAVLGAVLVLQQGPDRVHGSYRGLHRMGGTVLGVGVFAAIASTPSNGLVIIAVMMFLQFAIELSIPRNYGLAVVFITPLALLMGRLSHPDAALGGIVTDRLIETAVGIACAFIALWVVLPSAFRRALHWTDARVLTIAADFVAHARSHPVTAPRSLVLRRDVQFELVGASLAGVEAAHNDRAWTETRWAHHTEVERLGYELLAQCWATPDGSPLPRSGEWQQRIDGLA